jgi:hypothetical protein
VGLGRPRGAASWRAAAAEPVEQRVEAPPFIAPSSSATSPSHQRRSPRKEHPRPCFPVDQKEVSQCVAPRFLSYCSC